jgi:hypothetical protein
MALLMSGMCIAAGHSEEYLNAKGLTTAMKSVQE